MPTFPDTNVPGITLAELFVSRDGQALAFDADGNLVDGGGVPVVMTAGSATLRLPPGTYDFAVMARDDGDNDLADGQASGVALSGDATVPIQLTSFVETATLTPPQSIVPNQVVDIALHVHPPGRPDLVVPTGDFSASFTASTAILSTSNRGVRLAIECEAITVSATVSDLRGNPSITEVLVLPASAFCDSYGGGIGVDAIPPFLDLDPTPTTVTVGTTTTLTGTVFDAQSGIATVSVHDGPIHLGDAAIDASTSPHGWSFPFTPAAARTYQLTVTATDHAGNQTVASASMTAEAAVTSTTFATSAGGTDNDRAWAVSVLADGSAIITGEFSGTATFGATTLTSAGGADVFVAKVNPDGTWAWATRAGGPGNDAARSVSTLADGSVIITGYFTSTATFGATTLTSSGNQDVFVAKTNPAGSWAWATRAGGTNNDWGLGADVVADGSAIITGYFTSTATFGTTTLTSNGNRDVFVAKTNPDGTWAWATRAGGIFDDVAGSVSTLADGSAIITGYITNTAVFGTTTLTSNGNQDVFVAKTNPDGTWAWATNAGGTSNDSAQGVSALTDGSAIITGSFWVSATFGATTLTSNGGRDVFVAKTNPDGTWAWATSAGGTNTDDALGVSALADGSAIITGYFFGTSAFGATTLTSAGNTADVFVAKTNPDGTWAWATNAGGTSDDRGLGASVLADGSAIITGYFSGTATFGANTLTSAGSGDIFVAKIDPGGQW